MPALKDCLSKAVKGELLTEEESAFVSQKAAAQTGMTRKEAELWAAKDMLRDAIGELDSIARQVGKTQGASTRKSTVVLKTKDPDMAMAAMLEEHQIVAEKRIAAKREEEQGVIGPQTQAEAELEAAAPGEKGAAKQTRTYEAMREKVLGLIERNRQLIREREFKEGMTIGGAPLTAAEMKAQGITEESVLRLQHQKLLAALGELNAVMKFMPPEVRGKAGGFFQIAKSGEPLGAILSERLERVAAELDKLMGADYRERIEKLVKGAQAQKKAGVTKGTLGAEPQMVMDAITAASKMDAKQAGIEMNTIDAQLAGGELTAEEELALRERWAIINSFSDLENRPVEHLADVYHQLRDFVSGARKTWRAKQEARMASDRAKAESIIAGLPAVTDQGLARLNKWDLASRLRAFGLQHLNFAQFLNAILPESATFKNDWVQRARRAETMSQDQVRDAGNRLTIALQEALGAKGALSMANSLSDLKAENVEATLKNGEKLKMSKLEAIQYILSWEQADVRQKMEPHHWGEAAVDQLRAATSDPMSQTITNFLRDEYERTYQVLNPVYREMFGINMPRIPGYAPTRYDRAEGQKDISPMGVPLSQSGTTPGNLKARVAHKNRLLRQDALTVYWQHMSMATHWANHAELVREMRAVMGNVDARAAIKAKFGKPVDDQISAWINAIAHQGETRSEELAATTWLVHGLISTKALSSLGLNLRSVAMQTDSGLRFLLNVPMHRAMAAMTNPKFWESIPASWHSETIQRRVMSGGSPEARYMFDKAQMTPSVILSLSRMGMMPMQLFDAGLTSISSAIVYTDAYNQAKKQGMDDGQAEVVAAEAMDEAVWRYSQPVGISNRSLLSVTGNPLLKSFTLFMTDPILKSTIMWESIRGVISGQGGARAMHAQRLLAIELMAITAQTVANIYRDLFSSDDDDEIWTQEGYMKAMALPMISGMFVVGTVLDVGISEFVGEKWWAPARDPLIEAAQRGRQAIKHIEDIVDINHPDEMLKEWDHVARTMVGIGAVAGPPGAPVVAMPAMLVNALKPGVGLLWGNLSDKPEERSAMENAHAVIFGKE